MHKPNSNQHHPTDFSEHPDQFNDDIDSFHRKRNKSILSGRSDFTSKFETSDDDMVSGSESSEEQQQYEIMGLQPSNLESDESANSETDSFNDRDKIEDYISSEASEDETWGRNKKPFYGTNFIANEKRGVKEDDQQAADEEREGKEIQQRLSETLQKRHLIPEELLESLLNFNSNFNTESPTLYTTNIGKLDEMEKFNLKLENSPELVEVREELINTFKTLRDKLLNTLQFLYKNEGLNIKKIHLFSYLESKTQLYLMYCINIMFYLSIVANNECKLELHPVTLRIAQYRDLMSHLEFIDSNIEIHFLDWIEEERKHLEMRVVADLVDDSTTIKIKTNKLIKPKINRKLTGITPKNLRKSNAKKQYQSNANNDVDPLEFYNSIVKDRQLRKIIVSERNTNSNNNMELSEELELEGKRAINYKIAKNKGLTPRRKKELKNPRVRQKVRYLRAMKRRKGQAPAIRSACQRYSGEAGGIRDDISRSTFIK